MSDARLFSAACERNRGPILEVLRAVLPDHGRVLEIAAGTGMHAVHFAARLPALDWQPTDADEAALASIAAWREAGLRERPTSENLRPPLRLDVTAAEWPVDVADALFNANMIHISPWACTVGLFTGAARVLRAGAPMVLYGPYKLDGRHTAPSNARFDASLRARDPRWGVRDLDEVRRLAAEHGFAFERRVEMPANNQTVVFRRER
ncbi:MAG TPA: DUF938 domain-containing protein [Sandaracinaceae bacterium LLY-WYZ-13_1]|nr:DUF938 domain-containing protein [Sandaracinaceae bacterium LLY-WYZ-13_1]